VTIPLRLRGENVNNEESYTGSETVELFNVFLRWSGPSSTTWHTSENIEALISFFNVTLSNGSGTVAWSQGSLH
jgi:hypothetical protein